MLSLALAKRCVACCSAKDLAHWTFRSQVIKQADPGDLGTPFVPRRPKVLYNARTKKSVMYVHIAKLSDDYLTVERSATADSGSPSRRSGPWTSPPARRLW